jgi:hypothetical protein
MADHEDGALERAEGLFKRVLERVGATVDERVSSQHSRLPAPLVGLVTSRLEDALEAGVIADERGVRRVAPDRFEVLLTYEADARLSEGDRRALAGELAGVAFEYIVNHRYVTRAKIFVEVGCDIFARQPLVRATVSDAAGTAGTVRTARTDVAAVAPTRGRDVSFIGADGRVIRLRLVVGAEPVQVGRAAGNRIVIDHDSVSKFHATIGLAKNGHLLVTDLGSTNGTFIGAGRQRVSGAASIEFGDTVVFGEVAFRVEAN